MKFQSDWGHQFLQSSHTNSGQPISNAEAQLKEIQLEFAAIQSGVCFISDSDPFRFSLGYFTLLDLGASPIPISHEAPEIQKLHFKQSYPNASWVENGKLIHNGKSGASHSAASYACLTSGTTSLPKLCVLGVDGALKNALAHADSFGVTKSSRLVQALPVYHSFGLVCYLWTSVVKKCSIDFNSLSPSLNILSTRTTSEDVVYLSPAQLRFFARAKNLPKVSAGTVSIGGGAISNSEVEMFETVFPQAKRLVSYGLTEAGPRVTTGIAKSYEGLGSNIGRSLPGVSVFVKTATGLTTSGEGLLCIQSPSLKLNPENGEMFDEQTLFTRDHVRVENGTVFFISRDQDIIKTGGVSIYPADIETAARRFPGVKDCIVLKAPDKLYEEVAVLAVEGAVEEKDLYDFLNENLLPTQMPKQIFVMAELPRQSLNKVDRRTLLTRLGLS